MLRDNPALSFEGTGIDIAIHELIERIARVVGYTGRVAFETSKLDDPPRKLLDVSRPSKLGRNVRTAQE